MDRGRIQLDYYYPMETVDQLEEILTLATRYPNITGLAAGIIYDWLDGIRPGYWVARSRQKDAETIIQWYKDVHGQQLLIREVKHDENLKGTTHSNS